MHERINVLVTSVAVEESLSLSVKFQLKTV